MVPGGRNRRVAAISREDTSMAYSDKVIDHYEHPRNVGVLDKECAERRYRDGRCAGLRAT